VLYVVNGVGIAPSLVDRVRPRGAALLKGPQAPGRVLYISFTKAVRGLGTICGVGRYEF
jgi:hypothetical protein